MDTKLLEDFLSLAETGSFTRSAQFRHMTQPAFSRRIQALEEWVGADLIDRTVYPPRLTAAGELFREHAASIVEALRAARAQVRGQKPLPAASLAFALPHALALSFFPKWLSQIRQGFGALPCRLEAGNVHDAVMAFVEGECDLLLCYHHPAQPVELERRRYPGLVLGVERLLPFSACDEAGAPRYALPGEPGRPLPYLGYSAGAYLRRIADLILARSDAPCHLEQCYENDMAEGLKNMVLEGHGVAFLPESTVARELAQGQLAPAGDAAWGEALGIHLYRDARRANPAQDALWTFLASRYPAV